MQLQWTYANIFSKNFKYNYFMTTMLIQYNVHKLDEMSCPNYGRTTGRIFPAELKSDIIFGSQ